MFESFGKALLSLVYFTQRLFRESLQSSVLRCIRRYAGAVKNIERLVVFSLPHVRPPDNHQALCRLSHKRIWLVICQGFSGLRGRRIGLELLVVQRRQRK